MLFVDGTNTLRGGSWYIDEDTNNAYALTGSKYYN